MRWTPDKKPSWWPSRISFVSPNTGKLSKTNIITILESYKSQMNLDEDEDEDEGEEMELQEESGSVSRSDHPLDSDVEQGHVEHQEELSEPGDDMEHQDQISVEEPQPHWKKGLAGELIVSFDSNGVTLNGALVENDGTKISIKVLTVTRKLSYHIIFYNFDCLIYR